MGIQFTYPSILYALFLIVIPIIIHLFSFRKHKHVFFHNIHLLKTTQLEENRTKTKLKELLILISRILLISALVIAFAQPFIPAQENSNSSKTKYVSIYIDNSFSSQAESIDGAVIEQAKKQAQTIIDSYNKGSKYYIVSNEFDANDNIALTQEQAIQKVSTINISTKSQKVSDVCNRVLQFPQEKDFDLKQYVLSDFQRYTSDIENFPKDSNTHIILRPIKAQISQNLSIDSVWFNSPYRKLKQAETLNISIKNNGDSDYNKQTIKLYINDSLRSIANFNCKANSSSTIQLEYTINTPGHISAYVSIDDYPIIYDNTYFFSYDIHKEIKCLYVYNKDVNPYIKKLLGYDDYISFEEKNIQNINYNEFSNYDAIIFDKLETISSGLESQISKFAQTGKSVIIIPAQHINYNDYNNLLQNFGPQRIAFKDSTSIEASIIDYKSIILENIFENENKNTNYPAIPNHYTIVPRAFNPIISLENKDALLFKSSSKNSSIYLFTCPIENRKSEFATHPLFLSLYNMVLIVSQTNSIQTTIGEIVKTNNILLQKDNVIHIKNTEKQIDLIPQILHTTDKSKIHLQTFNEIKESGIYTIESNNIIQTKIAFNYNRKESIIDYLSTNEISELIKKQNSKNISLLSTDIDNLKAELQDKAEGKPLWRYFLLFAFICILLEIGLIRLLK